MSINCTKASNSDGPSGYTSDKNSSSITSDYDSTSTLGGTSSDSEYSDISNLEERVDFIRYDFRRVRLLSAFRVPSMLMELT